METRFLLCEGRWIHFIEDFIFCFINNILWSSVECEFSCDTDLIRADPVLLEALFATVQFLIFHGNVNLILVPLVVKERAILSCHYFDLNVIRAAHGMEKM